MKKIRRIVIILAACILMVGLTNIGTINVQAASTTITKSRSFYLYEGVNPERQISVMTSDSKAKITKLKNYNPDVVKVSVYDPNGAYGMQGTLRVQPLKAGVAKVTFRYAGKNFVYKILITKYENLCEQFKVGNTDFTKCFDKSGVYYSYQQKKNITGNIDVKLKNGWKIVKIKVDYSKTIKNHSKLTLSTNGSNIFMYVKNIKTGKVEEIVLYYSGNPYKSENSYSY